MSVVVHHASCLDWLAGYDGPLFDSCVTDPPYHLASIVARFGKDGSAPAKVGQKPGSTGAYARASKGFMGKEWDGGDIAFRPETWRAVYDALKPGAHLVAFSGTRTYHRMACAIEDAGFEIRDQLAFCYGSGFPKSHNINKALGKQSACCECENPVYEGHEDQGQKAAASVLQHDLRSVPVAHVSEAERPSDERGEVLQQGLPELSSQERGGEGAEPEIAGREQSGMEGRCHAQTTEGELQGRSVCASAGVGQADGAQRRLHHGTSPSDGADVRLPADANGSGQSHRPQPVEQSPEQPRIVSDERRSQTGRSWPICAGCGKPRLPAGLGSALKPSWEPICLARKPIAEKNIAANVLAHGTGALNVDGCRVGTEERARLEAGYVRNGRTDEEVFGTGYGRPKDVNGTIAGRFPANLLHDGSEDVLAGFPETGASPAQVTQGGDHFSIGSAAKTRGTIFQGYGESAGGSAARFFYSAKAGPLDRIGTAHATVKPVDLMRWLCRLVTPPGGHILEPFAGSGTTGIAAMADGFDCTMIELEAEHVADIARKLAFLRGEGGASVIEKHKARIERSKGKADDHGPLFGDAA